MSTAPNEVAPTVWSGNRLSIADLFRGLAAVCIVWHHLSLYAPQSDLADRFAPRIGYFLFNHALYAVALFFVLGGLTSSVEKESSKQQDASAWKSLINDIFCRYVRIAAPYLVMLTMLLLVSFATDRLNWPLNLFDSFSWPMLAAHIPLLQDVLGFGNFSAGTWYLCIELQWSCLVLVLGFFAHQIRLGSLNTQSMRAMILFPLGLASAWYWSQSEKYEAYVLFFAAQYVLGLFLGWCMQGTLPYGVLISYGLSIAASLAIYPRPQLMVSLLFAGIIWFSWHSTSRWQLPKTLKWLSEISYSLFLVHYLVNGLVLKTLNPWAGQSPKNAALAMLVAFVCSLGIAHLFHRWVETPTNHWIKRFRKPSAAA